MDLRDMLKEKLEQLEKEEKLFNDLHRKAKYLKKKMVVTRNEIAELERKINNDKK